MYVSTKEPDFWQDGSEYDRSHRPYIAVIDGKWRKLPVIACRSGMMQLQLDDAEYDNPDDISRQYKWEKIPPSRLFVCRIGNYRPDAKEGDYKTTTIGAVAEAMKQVLKAKSIEHLRNPFEDVDTQGFGQGYRVHWEPNGGWDQLIVSLIWVYYSK